MKFRNLRKTSRQDYKQRFVLGINIHSCGVLGLKIFRAVYIKLRAYYDLSPQKLAFAEKELERIYGIGEQENS